MRKYRVTAGNWANNHRVTDKIKTKRVSKTVLCDPTAPTLKRTYQRAGCRKDNTSNGICCYTLRFYSSKEYYKRVSTLAWQRAGPRRDLCGPWTHSETATRREVDDTTGRWVMWPAGEPEQGGAVRPGGAWPPRRRDAADPRHFQETFIFLCACICLS